MIIKTHSSNPWIKYQNFAVFAILRYVQTWVLRFEIFAQHCINTVDRQAYLFIQKVSLVCKDC
jgi:hypothetical protein